MSFLKHKICEAMYGFYRIRINAVRKVLLREVTKLEGGQMFSNTLRRIFEDYHNIEIGMYSYGGCFNPNNIRPHTKIGRYCSFAGGVYVFNANHPLAFKSTHPFFYEPSFGYVETEQISRRRIEIGNDVWIGENAIILSSACRIGDGAVIGAGAVVTKEVPDFAVVAGNPARLIKYRFSENTIVRLKEEKWWDKNIEELRGSMPDFLNEYEAKHKQI